MRFNERDDNLHELIDIELFLLPMETWLDQMACRRMWCLRHDENICVEVLGYRCNYLFRLQGKGLVIRRALRVLQELTSVFHLCLQVEELLERVVEEHDLSG